MRVTNKMLSNSFLSDMRTNLSNMRKLQQQMTSGKEVRRPSDDPFKVARSMQLHTDISTNKQYNENISDTINWLDTTDTALGQAGDVLQRVRELLISAGNAGYSENERLAIKDEINEKVGEVAQILNTNFDGAYIFGGTRGTTKPVDVIGGTNFASAASTDKIVIDKVDLTSIVDSDYKLKNNIIINIGPIKIDLRTDGKIMIGDPAVEEGEFDPQIKNLNELSSVINTALQYTDVQNKLKTVPNFSDGTIMFINTNSELGVDPSNVYTISASGININKTESTYSESNLENTRLIYNKKSGGELVNGNEYSQIGSKLKVQISQGVVMDYNVTATEVLEFKNEKGQSKDLRNILSNIVNHLDGKNDDGSTANPEVIKDLVGVDLQNITDTISNLLKIRAEVGAKQNRMDSAKEKNIEANFNMTEILSKTEDIDITEKTMEFANMQTVYLASLQTSAKVLQPSLIDYL